MISIAVWHDEISKDKVINLMEKDNFLREPILVSMMISILTLVFSKRKIKNSEEIAYVTYQVPKNFLMKLLDGLANAEKFSGKI